MVGWKASAGAGLLAALTACGGHPATVVAPVGETAVVESGDAFPHLKFGDGLVSANDRCPVTKRKLSVNWPPVYVNGKPFGFC